MKADLLVGIGDTSDFVESRQFDTIERMPVITAQAVNFSQHNAFGYIQLDFKPVPWLKLTGGVRYDHFFFDIDDRANRRNISPNTGNASPKAGITVSPFKGLDIYANFGEGFRPPSAVNGELSLSPNLSPSTMTSEEIGAQFNSADGVWHAAADVYHTRFENEIQENPEPMPPTTLGPSRREGFDVEGRWRAFKHGERSLSFFANYSMVDARLLDRPGGIYIPNVADWTVTYGFDLALPLLDESSPHVFTLSAYDQWVGPKALTTDRVEVTSTYTRVAANLNYTNKRWNGLSAFVQDHCVTGEHFGRGGV